MKKLLYLFAFVAFSSTAFSQGIIDRNYSQYVDQEDVTHVYVSGKLFDFAATIAAGIEDEEVKELSEFASKIESFSLIKVPNPASAQKEFKKGLQDVSQDYDELMRVRDEGTKFAIFVDEEDDVVYEVVGLGVVEGEFIALSLVGEMDLNKIAEFVSKTDSEALAPLKRIAEYNPDELKVYPNPTSANTELNVEVPEEMIGGTATLINSNGAKVKSFTVNNMKQSIDTDGLAPGNYFMELQKESISMKKQVIIIQ